MASMGATNVQMAFVPFPEDNQQLDLNGRNISTAIILCETKALRELALLTNCVSLYVM